MAVVVNARGGAARPVFRRRASRSGWLGVAAVTPVALLILAVAVHCLDLLFSGQHRSDVIRLFSDATYYQILLNTAVYSLFATTIAMLVGVPIAWFSERIARSGARWIRVAMIAGTVVPGFFVAMGWLLLGHSRIGFFANLGIPINITSLGGLAFAQGLALASLVFVMIAPSMAALSQSLEESAAIHGMNRVAIWRHVLLPLLKPALIACGSDQAEAMALADRIAVMADAQVRQVGTPREIYSRPAHPRIAAFLGDVNWAPGRIEGSGLRTDFGLLQVAGEGLSAGPATAGIRPEDVLVFPGAVEGQASAWLE